MTHRGVMRRGEEETHASFVQRSPLLLQRGSQVNTQRAEHVGAAGAPTHCPVAVLGDLYACAGQDEGHGGREVEGRGPGPAGAANVDHLIRVLQDRRLAAHRPRASGDLADRLAAQAHGGDRRGDLRGTRLAAKAGGEKRVGVRLRQRRAVSQARQQRPEYVRHRRPRQASSARATPARSRKLANRWWPPSVAIDSGWNCTPNTGRSRWCMPMISPSSVQASTTKTSGEAVAGAPRGWVMAGCGEAFRHARRTVRGPCDGSGWSCHASAPWRAPPRRRKPGRSPDGPGKRQGSAGRPAPWPARPGRFQLRSACKDLARAAARPAAWQSRRRRSAHRCGPRA